MESELGNIIGSRLHMNMTFLLTNKRGQFAFSVNLAQCGCSVSAVAVLWGGPFRCNIYFITGQFHSQVFLQSYLHMHVGLLLNSTIETRDLASLQECLGNVRANVSRNVCQPAFFPSTCCLAPGYFSENLSYFVSKPDKYSFPVNYLCS